MKIDDCTLEGVHTIGGGETPPSVGLTSDALPDTQTNKDKSTQSGVSTRYAPSAKTSNTNIAEKPNNILTNPLPQKHPEETQQWYALRTHSILLITKSKLLKVNVKLSQNHLFPTFSLPTAHLNKSNLSSTTILTYPSFAFIIATPTLAAK